MKKFIDVSHVCKTSLNNFSASFTFIGDAARYHIQVLQIVCFPGDVLDAFIVDVPAERQIQ